jgi:hypothetical protein
MVRTSAELVGDFISRLLLEVDLTHSFLSPNLTNKSILSFCAKFRILLSSLYTLLVSVHGFTWLSPVTLHKDEIRQIALSNRSLRPWIV